MAMFGARLESVQASPNRIPMVGLAWQVVPVVRGRGREFPFLGMAGCADRLTPVS